MSVGLFSKKQKITYSCESGDGPNITNYIDFFNVTDGALIRYEVLKEMIGNENAAVLINTNFNSIDPDLNQDQVIMKMIDELKQRGLDYTVSRVPKEHSGIFGGLLKKVGDKKAYKLFFILPAGQFDQDTAKSFFEYYDVDLGIGFKLNKVEDLLEKFKMGFLEMIELGDMFEGHIFSALNFHRIKLENKKEEQPRIEKLVQYLNELVPKK